MSDIGKVVHQIAQAAGAKRSIANVVILLESFERGRVIAGDSKGAIIEDPLGIAHVTDKFFHTPFVMGWEICRRIIKYGEAMLLAELLEQGYPDRFLGLMVDLHYLPWSDIPGTYTQNTIDRPEYVLEARKAIADGAWYIHGVKTAAQLKAVTGP